MAEPAARLLTFDEFVARSGQGRYELVNGQLEELVPPRPLHSWTGTQIAVLLDPYLKEHTPGGFWGVELDVPTVPFHGRRPDFAYYSPADAARVDLEGNRVLGVPTLAIEVVSSEDEARDTITKRQEYARARIAHYWILDPDRRTALTLTLDGDAYRVAGEYSEGDSITSELFPGLEIPLAHLFR